MSARCRDAAAGHPICLRRSIEPIRDFIPKPDILERTLDAIVDFARVAQAVFAQRQCEVAPDGQRKRVRPLKIMPTSRRNA